MAVMTQRLRFKTYRDQRSIFNELGISWAVDPDWNFIHIEIRLVRRALVCSIYWGPL